MFIFMVTCVAAYTFLAYTRMQASLRVVLCVVAGVVSHFGRPPPNDIEMGKNKF